MQYALMQAAAIAIPVSEPIDFQTLPNRPCPDILNLHFKHHKQFETFEIQEANDKIQQESQGTRPKDHMRPWSTHPFGRWIRSQTSFTRHSARQEDYIQSKKWEKFDWTLVRIY